MTKTTSIPRISIVVPVGSNLEAFEDTLASVLQNRPVASEILVAHDGHYTDPFQLGDEVTFVTSDSASTVDLVMAGARPGESPIRTRADTRFSGGRGLDGQGT